MSSYKALEGDQRKEIEAGVPYDIYHISNIAIVMAYFSIGVVQSFLSTPLNIYLVEVLNAEPQMQNTIGILQTLPWSMKLVFGFISDAVPIYGMNRKPYLAIGSLLYSFSFMAYSLVGKHDVTFLSVCTFLGTLGLIQMDVMADTMCVQRSKFEPEETKGQMQASCYSIRFAGSLLGAIMGATLCNKDSWGWGLDYFEVSFLIGVIPFILVTPCLFSLRERFKSGKDVASLEMGTVKNHATHSSEVFLAEEHSLLIHDQHTVGAGYHSLPHVDLLPHDHSHGHGHSHSSNGHTNYGSTASQDTKEDNNKDTATYSASEEDDEAPKSISDQLNEIWQTVQLQSVWRPMAFVYIFNLFQVPNVAWQSFLQLSLNFPGWILGATVILGSFMTFAGVLAYKYFFFKSSWRSIYIWTVLLTTFFSLLQLILIFQWNTKYLHLNNYLFSLGDDVISAYISGIQFLPLCIMYMRLCPEGAEGSSYAMLTTFGNIALVCASNVGNLLAGIWDVSNTAMRNHNYDGLWKLNTLTSCLAVLPLCLLFLLPRDAEEQERLSKSQVRSKTAGIVFLVVLIGSLTWTTCTAIFRILT